jgi:hypothetical protein
MTTEEIIESMMETIAELEQGITACPSGKRDLEITLVSSGMSIVQVETDEEALVWNRG